MAEYLIKLNTELAEALKEQAAAANLSEVDYLTHIAKLFLSLPHSINRESMAANYEEMGEINLALANIGDCSDGYTEEHKKRDDILRGPKPRGRK